MKKKNKETIVKVNNIKSWFFEKIKNCQAISQTHQEKKKRIKSTKLEMKRRGYNRQCRNTKDYKTLL